MSKSHIQIYSTSSTPNTAYLLIDGSVYFYASNVDKYKISGKNLIFGCTEIIMNNLLDVAVERIETAVLDKDALLKRMPVEKVMGGLYSYSLALNISMVMAKQVQLTNKIINNNLALLDTHDKKLKEISLQYYKIVSELTKDYDQQRLPWLKALIDKYQPSLTFKKGEAFFKTSKPTKIKSTTNLSHDVTEFEKDSIICETQTTANEMYLLQSGSIDVFISGNKVATINEPGTIIGEMALLLGEARSATLKANNNVVLTTIKKENLKKITEKEREILPAIAISLAKKHFSNLQKIEDINRKVIEKSIKNDSDKHKFIQKEKASSELRSLQSEINELTRKQQGADFLNKYQENI